jgi:hypothetical protein
MDMIPIMVFVILNNVYTNYAEEGVESLGNSIDPARSNPTERRASLLARFMLNARTHKG